MQVEKNHRGGHDYKPNVKAFTVPKIVDHVKDEDGLVTHYLCEGNRLFEKVAYDRNFGINHGIKMRDKRYKGKSLDSRIVY
jgi:hypothetical protein